MTSAAHSATGRPAAPGAAYWRLVALVAVALAFVSVEACEHYTVEYQTLPAIDWLEAQPPLDEGRDLPDAATLARGLAAARPELLVRDDAAPFLPRFAPPGIFERTVGGVRDAATIAAGAPDPATAALDQDRVSVKLEVVVFHRAARARAWAELLTAELDSGRSREEARQLRVTGPDERDGGWVSDPREARPGTGRAIVVGQRGPVGFDLRATSERPTSTDPLDALDLAARAEGLARQAAADWATWLAQQPRAGAW